MFNVTSKLSFQRLKDRLDGVTVNITFEINNRKNIQLIQKEEINMKISNNKVDKKLFIHIVYNFI